MVSYANSTSVYRLSLLLLDAHQAFEFNDITLYWNAEVNDTHVWHHARKKHQM